MFQAQCRTVVVAEWIIGGWGIDQSHQQGGAGQAERIRGCAEIGGSSIVNPIGIGSVECLVYIEFEQTVFISGVTFSIAAGIRCGKEGFYLQGQKRLR